MLDVDVPQQLADSPVQKRVYEALDEAGETMKRSEIVDATGIEPQSVSQALRGLRGRDLAKKVGHGFYKVMKQRAEKAKERVAENSDNASLQVVPVISAGAGSSMNVVRKDLQLPTQWIRQTYDVQPSSLCLVRVRGDSMRPTLQPGQRLMAKQYEGDELEDGSIYGLRGPLGVTIKRIRFDRIEDEPRIWVWSDNEAYADQRRHLPRERFEEEYEVILQALEASQML
jgi:SOS-response transcriptional repressor LexA